MIKIIKLLLINPLIISIEKLQRSRKQKIQVILYINCNKSFKT